jgi:hypothetical protein
MPAMAIMLMMGKSLKRLNDYLVNFGNCVKNSCLSVNILYNPKQLSKSIRNRNMAKTGSFIFVTYIFLKTGFHQFPAP